MNKPAGNNLPDQPDAWTWPEERRCTIVEKIRAGRSLRPESWPSGANRAVTQSFDSDHEIQTLGRLNVDLG